MREKKTFCLNMKYQRYFIEITHLSESGEDVRSALVVHGNLAFSKEPTKSVMSVVRKLFCALCQPLGLFCLAIAS